MEPNLQQGSAVLLVPFRPDLQASFPAPNVNEVAPNSSSVISKPHARILVLEGFVHMGSEGVAPAVVETSKSRSSSGKMNQGKVPKKIHKAEREKMKREHLNELFLDLANALDVNENNGKASILCEAARLLKDLLSQIESLKKENVTLLSESHYVTMEKNELKEENCSLETKIEKLQGEIQARVAQSKPDLNVPPNLELEPLEQSNFPGQSLQLHTMEPNLQQGSAVLLVPFRPDLQASFPAPNVNEVAPNSSSVISKPHARYPTAADSWPSQLLG
ncbi:Myc-type [Vigna unguiculata]|uniref:Myc-type n=1 Tax=Vigna unguiculata TaxID=3917 RepID=A0A4D6KS45_VIGUN|nr:Myc-type [Vigna unguiculata]